MLRLFCKLPDFRQGRLERRVLLISDERIDQSLDDEIDNVHEASNVLSICIPKNGMITHQRIGQFASHGLIVTCIVHRNAKQFVRETIEYQRFQNMFRHVSSSVWRLEFNEVKKSLTKFPFIVNPVDSDSYKY